MSAANIHESTAPHSVRTGAQAKADGKRTKNAKRAKKQRAKTGNDPRAGGRNRDEDYASDEGGSTRSGRSSSRNRGGGGGGGPVECGSASSGGIVQIFTLISALSVLIIGFWHFFQSANSLDVCNDNNNNITGVECVGDALFWENGISGETSSNLNVHWRQVFTFDISTFIDLWTPMVFGVISCLQLISGMQWFLISGNMLRCMLWHLIMALFACFGYCGQAGIIVGFIVSFTGFLCLIAIPLHWGGAPYLTIMRA